MSKIKEDYENMKDNILNSDGDINRQVSNKNNKNIPIKANPDEYDIPDEKKESTLITTTKLNIYEAYDNGYISESEKCKLLTLVNATYMLESDNDDEDDTKEIKKYVKTLTKIIAIVGILIVAYKAAEKVSNKKHGYDVTIKELEKFSNECYKNLDDAFAGKITITEVNEKRLHYLHKAQQLVGKCKGNPFIKLTPEQEKKLSYLNSEIACGGMKH